jgi:hypothetical protein
MNWVALYFMPHVPDPKELTECMNTVFEPLGEARAR